MNTFKPSILPKDLRLPRSGIICSHPERADRFATQLLNGSELVTSYRGYKVYVGTYKNQKVFVAYVGIGAPSAAILIEELIAMGAEKIVRVGTNDNPTENDEGTVIHVIEESIGTKSLSGLDSEQPDIKLLKSIVDQSVLLGVEVGRTKALHIDLYYHFLKPAVFAEHPDKIESVLSDAERKNIRIRDMESACLFFLGRLRQIQTASILHTILRHSVDREYGRERDLETERKSGLLALEALTAS